MVCKVWFEKRTVILYEADKNQKDWLGSARLGKIFIPAGIQLSVECLRKSTDLLSLIWYFFRYFILGWKTFASFTEIELKKILRPLDFGYCRYFAKFLDHYPRTKIRCDPLEGISSLVLLFRARNCDAWHNGFKIFLKEHFKKRWKVLRSKALKVLQKIAPDFFSFLD